MITVYVAVGERVVEVSADCPYSPDVLDDLRRHAATLLLEAGDLDDDADVEYADDFDIPEP